MKNSKPLKLSQVRTSDTPIEIGSKATKWGGEIISILEGRGFATDNKSYLQASGSNIKFILELNELQQKELVISQPVLVETKEVGKKELLSIELRFKPTLQQLLITKTSFEGDNLETGFVMESGFVDSKDATVILGAYLSSIH